MWHRFTLTTEEVAEGEERRILNIVSQAHLQSMQALWERIAALRQAGHLGEIPLQETPVEMDSFGYEDRIVLHLNDAALRLYQANGGTRRVEATIPNLPHGRPARMLRNTLFSIA